MSIFEGIFEQVFSSIFALQSYTEYLEFRRYAVLWVPNCLHAPYDQKTLNPESTTCPTQNIDYRVVPLVKYI